MAIYLLKPNRVWRTYLGGRKLSELYNDDQREDSHYPETWIASVTQAINPNMVEGEGLSYVPTAEMYLRDLIERDPIGMLGVGHVEHHGPQTGILMKFLDAAERLTIQVHPNKLKARSLFNSEFGKTEAWYIMDGREINGEAPYIYMGFKENVTAESWRQLFDTQDIEGMLNALHKIPVKSGQVYLIEGGLPHAIGSGCFIMEIQEPTDYTIRVERTTPDNYVIPDQLIHQGLGFERMHECFEFEGLSKDEVLKRWRLIDGNDGNDEHQSLISYEDTKCFGLERYQTKETVEIPMDDRFYVLVATGGEGTINSQDEMIEVKAGDQIFISANTGVLNCKSRNNQTTLNLLKCCPPQA